ncbi:MAG: exonuclease SbcCD subunit D [Thermoplasmata archaeon]
MRVFHVSDTHLGYAAYAKIDQARGLNQREADFYDSFERFVNICLKEEPDLVLHTGDLFDSVRPSNRAISFAMEQLRRLSDAGIEFIAISGNHETPRLRETGSVFKILEHVPSCRFSYGDEFLRIEKGSLEIICIPHSTNEQFRKNLKAVSNLKKQGNRIVMMHVGVSGIHKFRTDEANELVIDESDIDQAADYVALGHYHNHENIANNCSFAGSTERLSISEAAFEKGFIDVDLDGKSRKFVPLPTRRMIDMQQIDLSNLNPSDAKKAIQRELEKYKIDGAIVRMTITGVSGDTRRNLDYNWIRKVVQGSLSFDVRIIGAEEMHIEQSTSPRIGLLEEEFKAYLSKLPVEKLDKKRLESLADKFFSVMEE